MKRLNTHGAQGVALVRVSKADVRMVRSMGEVLQRAPVGYMVFKVLGVDKIRATAHERTNDDFRGMESNVVGIDECVRLEGTGGNK